MENIKNTVHLQGIGEKPAKHVSMLQAGDIVMWNYGYTSVVLDLTPSKTGKTFSVLLRSCGSGTVSSRKMSACSLVAIA